jgi:hypothetical protein
MVWLAAARALRSATLPLNFANHFDEIGRRT